MRQEVLFLSIWWYFLSCFKLPAFVLCSGPASAVEYKLYLNFILRVNVILDWTENIMSPFSADRQACDIDIKMRQHTGIHTNTHQIVIFNLCMLAIHSFPFTTVSNPVWGDWTKFFSCQLLGIYNENPVILTCMLQLKSMLNTKWKAHLNTARSVQGMLCNNTKIYFVLHDVNAYCKIIYMNQIWRKGVYYILRIYFVYFGWSIHVVRYWFTLHEYL